MRLILSSFMTLDGVMEGPGFDEHRDGRNAWALRRQGPEDEEWNKEQVSGADAILLGRTTYQIWAAFWPTAGGDDDFSRRMNEIPKYVVSRTLQRADWNNTTILSGDPAAEVDKVCSMKVVSTINYVRGYGRCTTPPGSGTDPPASSSDVESGVGGPARRLCDGVGDRVAEWLDRTSPI